MSEAEAEIAQLSHSFNFDVTTDFGQLENLIQGKIDANRGQGSASRPTCPTRASRRSRPRSGSSSRWPRTPLQGLEVELGSARPRSSRLRRHREGSGTGRARHRGAGARAREPVALAFRGDFDEQRWQQAEPAFFVAVGARWCSGCSRFVLAVLRQEGRRQGADVDMATSRSRPEQRPAEDPTGRPRPRSKDYAYEPDVLPRCPAPRTTIDRQECDREVRDQHLAVWAPIIYPTAQGPRQVWKDAKGEDFQSSAC